MYIVKATRVDGSTGYYRNTDYRLQNTPSEARTFKRKFDAEKKATAIERFGKLALLNPSWYPNPVVSARAVEVEFIVREKEVN